jgi:hypothetical protein
MAAKFLFSTPMAGVILCTHFEVLGFLILKVRSGNMQSSEKT